MLQRHKIQMKLSETRVKLSELVGVENPSEEQRSEMVSLQREVRDLEGQYQAALVAEPGPETQTSEEREMRSLIERCDVGRIFDFALERRNADGPEDELQKFFKLNSNQVPLELLRDRPAERRDVTPAPGDVGQMQDSIIPGVFASPVASFLSVDMPTVGTGEAVYPVLTQNAQVRGPYAASEEAAETTGSFAAQVLSPERLQASFRYRRVDAAKFAGMGEALRQNLNEALGEAVDKEVVSGANGLLTGANLANHNVTAITTFDNYLAEFGFARVDGRYADTVGALRVVVGSGTYAHMGKTYRNASVDRTILDRLMEITGGVRVSAHVPAVAGNKQNGVIRLGSRRDMVAPMWEGVTLIPDEITKADAGEIKVTAVLLHSVKILRAAGFYKQQSQHA